LGLHGTIIMMIIIMRAACDRSFLSGRFRNNALTQISKEVSRLTNLRVRPPSRQPTRPQRRQRRPLLSRASVAGG